MKSHILLAVSVVVAFAIAANAQENSSAPPSHPESSNGQANKCPMDTHSRENEGMGFSQAKTTHHFSLTKEGGVIAVEANDPKDTESRDRIRMHLAHIAKAFAQGDFDIPMFVHDQVPPGVSVMKARKGQINYRFEKTRLGGQVVITSNDAAVLSAVHDFLAFQIREHKTGDDLTVQ